MRRLFRPALALAAVLSCLSFVVPTIGYGQTASPSDIVARHAIVVDATSGDILFDKSANQPTAMASLTKLFTAFVAIESTPLDRQMTVHESDLVGEASMGLAAGEVLSFQTLLNGMLLPSGNDAATSIARNLGQRAGDSDSQAIQRFVDRQNARLASLGIATTHLVNPHGLDADGHYSTARDIAALTLYAMGHEPTFTATIQTATYTAEGHSITNTNRLLGNYDGLIGGKTGVTDNAGYCLMQVAERNGERIIIVLIGSTQDAWYDDAERLLDFGFTATAIPGSTTPLGQITFSATQPASVPNVEAVPGLEVSIAGSGTSIVSQTSLASSHQRSPWLWIVTAVVLMPAAILILSQVQRQPRRSRRPARGHRSRRRSHVSARVTSTPPPRPVHADTLPAWQTVAPDYRFDETTEWRVGVGIPASHRPHRRRADQSQYPALTPSYSGD